MIWDADKNCKHKWDIKQHKDTRGIEGSNLTGRVPYKEGEARLNYSEGCCQLCGAWCGSLGLEPTPELYIKHIVQIFREVKRVLRKDGTVWLNLGDSYWGGKGRSAHGDPERHIKRLEEGKTLNHPHQEIGRPGEIKPGDGKHHIYKPKDLCMLPARVVLALQADGWWLRQDIIWSKPNPMPESVTDRCTKSHEYLFLLTKSGTPKYWTHRDYSGARIRPKADWQWVNQITQDEITKAPQNWKDKIPCPECEGVGMVDVDISYEFMGKTIDCHQSEKCPVCEGKKRVQKWKRINLWRGHDYFFDNDAIREPHQDSNRPNGFSGKDGIGDRSTNQGWSGGKVSLDKHREYNPAGRNKRSVWQIATQPTPEAHFATFPNKLVEPCILAGTSEKGCCPECGAPWERVVEKGGGSTGKSWHDHESDMEQGQRATDPASKGGHGYYSKTIGWKPTCECYGPPLGVAEFHIGKKPIPCTVLDLFFGSGTVGDVAHKHGRNFIGIELSKPYLDDIAIPRIEKGTAQLKMF